MHINPMKAAVGRGELQIGTWVNLVRNPAVLTLLKEKKYPIPALAEYEYKGQGTPVEEVRKCLVYMRQALA